MTTELYRTCDRCSGQGLTVENRIVRKCPDCGAEGIVRATDSACAGIFAVDPGPDESGWVWLKEGRVECSGVHPNEEIKIIMAGCRYSLFGIEGIACYGMAVGQSTFEACEWIGRFLEFNAGIGADAAKVYRKEVKIHLCGTMKAKDANIRQALLDRYGSERKKAVGTKRSPGPLFGVSKHAWAALAVAVYLHETRG